MDGSLLFLMLLRTPDCHQGFRPPIFSTQARRSIRNASETTKSLRHSKRQVRAMMVSCGPNCLALCSQSHTIPHESAKPRQISVGGSSFHQCSWWRFHNWCFKDKHRSSTDSGAMWRSPQPSLASVASVAWPVLRAQACLKMSQAQPPGLASAWSSPSVSASGGIQPRSVLKPKTWDLILWYSLIFYVFVGVFWYLPQIFHTFPVKKLPFDTHPFAQVETPSPVRHDLSLFSGTPKCHLI